MIVCRRGLGCPLFLAGAAVTQPQLSADQRQARRGNQDGSAVSFRNGIRQSLADIRSSRGPRKTETQQRS